MIQPHDPRPDLPGTADWNRLLTRAHVIDGPNPHGVFGILHGMRCLGASLSVGKTVRLERGEIPEEDYARYRAEHLLPNHIGITFALNAMKGRR